MQPTATLNARERRFVELTAEGHTTVEVAELLGIHRVTAWRWLQRSEIARAIAHAEADIRRSAVRLITKYARETATVCRTIAMDPEQPESVRINASRVVQHAHSSLMPRELDITTMEVPVPVDLTDAQQRLEDMLASIRTNREQTTPEALRAAIGNGHGNGQTLGGNGHTNGHTNGHGNGSNGGG